MKKMNSLIMLVCLTACFGYLAGCATDTAPLKTASSLPQSKLARYNDSFDTLREDVWSKNVILAFTETSRTNFKIGDTRIENGKLIAETKTGCFSRAGLGGKYKIRGDFDIQIDCNIEFFKGVQDMEQQVVLFLADPTKEVKDLRCALIGAIKTPRKDFNFIYAGYYEDFQWQIENMREIGSSFNGALRMVRTGNKVTTLYRIKGEQGWEKLTSFGFTTNDVGFSFLASNFSLYTSSITAKSPVTVTFDNFKINAAQEIIESDI
ncbi:hypothetical protein ACFL2O_09190 [Thermodesulfobacteriota bacterium]